MDDFIAGTVFGVTLNETATLERLADAFHQQPYQTPPIAPVLYIKPRNTFARDGAVVPTPGNVRIDATVGAVIGRRASRVTAEHAVQHVKGYVVVGDLTLPHDSYYRPAVRLRCRDGFCPMSQPIMAGGFDLSTATLTVRVNDEVVHERRFDGLVRDLPQLLEAITSFITLEENDVVLVGPPDRAPVARAGDRVAIDVTGLGTLTHSLVAEGRS